MFPSSLPPILPLFIVLGLGYFLGEIPLLGIRLGVAGVLFVGLFVGALFPTVTLPPMILDLGLVMFIYTVGLSVGPSFKELFRTSGFRDCTLASAVLLTAGLLTWALAKAFGFAPPIAAGLFCGAITNTPALAAVREALLSHSPPVDEATINLPVVGYSIAYPFGVLGVVVALVLYKRIWRISIPTEEDEQPLVVRNYCVANPALFGRSIHDIMQSYGSRKFVITRVSRDGIAALAFKSEILNKGDIVAVVAEEPALPSILDLFGSESSTHIEEDRSIFDYRRVFVSNKKILGKTLRQLRLPEHLGAIVTRIKRGDQDVIPNAETVLESGDRVRILARRENLAKISSFLGDSIRASGETHLASLALGVSLGILLGSTPISLLGNLKLGLAGGCLIVGILLGSIGSTGPFTWRLPLPANLSLREFGIALFLAGVGVKAGHEFLDALSTYGLPLLLSGAFLTAFVALTTIFIAHRALRIPFDHVLGLVAGLQTQPSILGFATTLTSRESPHTAYASIYPAATILKIIIAQLLLQAL